MQVLTPLIPNPLFLVTCVPHFWHYSCVFFFLDLFSSRLLFFSSVWFFPKKSSQFYKAAIFVLDFYLAVHFPPFLEGLFHSPWILIACLVNLFSLSVIQAFVAWGCACGRAWPSSYYTQNSLCVCIFLGRIYCIRFPEGFDSKRDQDYCCGTVLKPIALQVLMFSDFIILVSFF